MIRIQPKYFYPGMVVALLVMSVTFCVITVVAAHSDGGPQVVENYYEKSLDYDRIRAKRQAAERAGWKVRMPQFQTAPREGELTIDVRGDRGPVNGLEGRVELRRPEFAGAVYSGKLRPVDGSPGNYVVEIAPDRVGLWDVVLDVERGDTGFLFEIRREVRE